MDTASRLNTLAREVEASDSATERSRFLVAQELDRAAELLPERVLPAIRHLESAKREVAENWGLKDEFGSRVLQTASAVIQGLERR